MGISNNNRINIIIAIIFLLGLSVLVKLYNLQISRYDWYIVRALSQHQVSGILEPERGRIFVQESQKGNDENFYPIASNKDFALIYAIPEEIRNANSIAENLFEIFRKEKIEKEVDELMEKIDDERLQNELAFISRENLGEEEKKKREKEERKAFLKDEGVPEDNYEESVIREFTELNAAEFCFKAFDVFKKSQGMASFPSPFDDPEIMKRLRDKRAEINLILKKSQSKV